MTNFVKKNINNVDVISIESYPTELESSWMYINKLSDHDHYSYVYSMYANNDLPKGTIVVSPYFYHKYPDIHSLYLHPTKESGIYYGVSGWVNPRHRRKGWWLWYGIMTRIIFLGNFNIEMDVGGDRDSKMEAAYQKVVKMLEHEKKAVKNDGRSQLPETEMQRDVVFPYTWYNHRIGGKIEREENGQ